MANKYTAELCSLIGKAYSVTQEDLDKINDLAKISLCDAGISRIEFDCNRYILQIIQAQTYSPNKAVKSAIKILSEQIDGLLELVSNNASDLYMQIYDGVIRYGKDIEEVKSQLAKGVHRQYRYQYPNLFPYEDYRGISTDETEHRIDDTVYWLPTDNNLEGRSLDMLMSDIDPLTASNGNPLATMSDEEIASEFENNKISHTLTLMEEHMRFVRGVTPESFYKGLREARTSLLLLETYLDKKGGPKGDPHLAEFVSGMSQTFSLYQNQIKPEKAKRGNKIFSRGCKEFIIYFAEAAADFLEENGRSKPNSIKQIRTSLNPDSIENSYLLKRAKKSQI